MKTFEELKKEITPQFIKKLCEFAEGFEYKVYEVNTGIIKDYVLTPNNKKPEIRINTLVEDPVLFSTLLHRAVAGFNGKFTDHKSAIYIKASVVEFYGKIGNGDDYRFRDYQPSRLTPCEMAILDCLIEVLK